MKINQGEIDIYRKKKADSRNFLKMIKKYTDFEILITKVFNEYMEKVMISEDTGVRKGKDRKQEVDVYFNFIGNIRMNRVLRVRRKFDSRKNALKNGITLTNI